MDPIDLFQSSINVEITENIKKILQEWANIVGTSIIVHSIEAVNQVPGLQGLQNNLAISRMSRLSGNFTIYTSNKYTEASIIHELLHGIIRAQGYCAMTIYTSRKLQREFPSFMDQCSMYASAVTNQMDHLLIHSQIKEYNLDIKKLNKIEYEYYRGVNNSHEYENEVDRILNNMLIGLNYFDYVNMVEPHKSLIIKKIKEENDEALQYGITFYEIASTNGYLIQETYKSTMTLILNKMKKIFDDQIKKKSIQTKFLDVLRIE
jgi:hypothetical protein